MTSLPKQPVSFEALGLVLLQLEDLCHRAERMEAGNIARDSSLDKPMVCRRREERVGQRSRRIWVVHYTKALTP